MPRTVKVTVYKFDELTPKAKEKARSWWRDTERELFGSFGELYEPIETAAKLLGIEFARTDVLLCGGSKRSEPTIYWGLHTQGSGASFEGSYTYKADCLDAVKSEFPQDAKLHEIAERLRLYGVGMTAKCDCNGAKYPHSGWMNVCTYDHEGEEVAAEVLQITLRAFADWIYRYIDTEWTYRMSDENIDESIRCSDYEFEADGTHFEC